MAQTVLMRRGTGTFSAGSSSATLFTQSGGLGTRVIFGGFTFYGTNTNNNTYITISVSASGGPIYPVGYIFNTALGAALLPVMDFKPVGTNSAAPSSVNIRFSTNTGSNWPAATLPSGATWNSSAGNGGAVLQNFWIGPSDAVIAYADTSSNAQNFGYSFTTITES